MSQFEKLLIKVLSGAHDKNIKFAELQNILYEFGFTERIRGDHFIYVKSGVAEIINIQPVGNKAKPYQVKQVRNIIVRYGMGGGIDA